MGFILQILDNSELQNCLIKIAELQTKMQEKTDVSNKKKIEFFYALS